MTVVVFCHWLNMIMLAISVMIFAHLLLTRFNFIYKSDQSPFSDILKFKFLVFYIDKVKAVNLKFHPFTNVKLLSYYFRFIADFMLYMFFVFYIIICSVFVSGMLYARHFLKLCLLVSKSK